MAEDRAVLKTIVFAVLLAAVAVVGLMLWHRQNDLERRLLLMRVTQPGRTADQVRAWMGPGMLEEHVKIPGIDASAVLIYRSTPPGSLQGSEDVWLALDEHERVIAVYYPDFPMERDFLNTRR